MNGPVVTSPVFQPSCPKIAARPKKTVAETITSMCQLAVHQSGERQVIDSQ